MHVLFITGSYPPLKCGVGAYTQRLAQALAEFTDVKVTVLTDTRAIGATVRDGVEVLPVISGWYIPELIRVVKYVWRLSPDVVHIQYPSQGYSDRMPKFMPLLMRMLRVPCIQTWHEPVLDKRWWWMSLGMDALITVREELMSILPDATQHALRHKRFSWIPAASILPTVILRDDERSEIRRRYISDSEILLVYYGFVAPLKGIEVLLETIAKTNA